MPTFSRVLPKDFALLGRYLAYGGVYTLLEF